MGDKNNEQVMNDYFAKMYSESYEQAKRQYSLAESGAKKFIHDLIKTTLSSWETSREDDRLLQAKALATNIATALKDLADLGDTVSHFKEQLDKRLEELSEKAQEEQDDVTAD